MKKILLIALSVIILDQLTKFFVKNFFNYKKNYGAVFGLLEGQTLIFIIVALMVVFYLLYLSKEVYQSELTWAFGFLLGGTIGNLIDRLYLGYVIDFIDLKLWPTFNIADMFNVFGALILAFYLLRRK